MKQVLLPIIFICTLLISSCGKSISPQDLVGTTWHYDDQDGWREHSLVFISVQELEHWENWANEEGVLENHKNSQYSIENSTIEIEDEDESRIGEFEGDILTIDLGYGEVEFVKQH